MMTGPLQLQYERETVNSEEEQQRAVLARYQCHRMGAWSPWLSGRRMNGVHECAMPNVSELDFCVFGSVETVVVSGFQDDNRTTAAACRSLTDCSCSHLHR